MRLFGLRRKKEKRQSNKKEKNQTSPHSPTSTTTTTTTTNNKDAISTKESSSSSHKTDPVFNEVRGSSSLLGSDSMKNGNKTNKKRRARQGGSDVGHKGRNGTGNDSGRRSSSGGGIGGYFLPRSGDNNNDQQPTMEQLPQLIQDLKSSIKTSSDKPARALRHLFTLSEHGHSSTNRTDMVHKNNNNSSNTDHHQLVPTLFEFLLRCQRGSSEQYLTLLVLNNISIPSSNKRTIALDHGGAKILARLLCMDPSCHLMAIVLVNLSFADADLRKELVSPQSGIELVEALSFSLRVASLSAEEYESRRHIIEEEEVEERDDTAGDSNETHKEQSSAKLLQISPKERLAKLIAIDQQLRRARIALEPHGRSQHGLNYWSSSRLVDIDEEMFPETTRWCLSALKNLTRPSKDMTAVKNLVQTGIVPLILEFVTISAVRTNEDADEGVTGGKVHPSKHHQPSEEFQSPSAKTSSPTRHSHHQADPLGHHQLEHSVEFINAPTNWDSNSMQDAALSLVMNIAAHQTVHDYLKERGAVSVLSFITKYRSLKMGDGEESGADEDGLTTEERSQEASQCMKAKMALAFLLGSEGHYGQTKLSSSASTVYASPDDSVLLLSEMEIHLLVELLANTLHNRAKDGTGGYSAATFSVKYVLLAWRCLLTHTLNQIRVTAVAGPKLNCLLTKALAQHAIGRVSTLDAEAAEYAAFALYLQSNHGFKDTFMPSWYYSSDDQRSLVSKVFTAYLKLPTVLPAGRHAAEQMLLRVRHLIFKGRILDLASSDGKMAPTVADMTLEDHLLVRSESIFVERRHIGAKPRKDIFDRPILRSRAPRKGNNQRAPWDNRALVSAFPSALQAVQQLSYGSTKVRHVGYIDDIAIANNIASSANGQKIESYNFWWSWQDTAGEIQRNLERERSQESSSLFSGINSLSAAKSVDGTEPLSIFGFRCFGCYEDVTTTG